MPLSARLVCASRRTVIGAAAAISLIGPLVVAADATAVSRSDDRPPALDRAASAPRIVPAGRSRRTAVDQRRAELLGRLVHLRMDVDFDAVPARYVIPFLAERLGVPLRAHWSGLTSREVARRTPAPRGAEDVALAKGDELGLDPDAPITLAVEGATGLDLIEAVIQQCAPADGAEVTWQFHGTAVEVGTKRRLNRPAARRRQAFDVGEAAISVPNFVGPSGGFTLDSVRPGQGRERVIGRKTLEEATNDLADGLQFAVEPDAWADGAVTWRTRPGWIIVHGPDYVLRGIDGYPFPAIVPTEVPAAASTGG